MSPPRIKMYSGSSCVVYLTFAWFWGICYGFVLLSSAAGTGEVHVFQPGGAWTYHLRSTVLLNDRESADAKNIGFSVKADVVIESIWAGSKKEHLLKITLLTPNLQIKSAKPSDSGKFESHTSELESYKNEPFYVVWKHGKIQKILLRKNEPLALANFKKGVASLLQFQHLDQEINETDASGNCQITYRSTGPNTLTKSKTNCKSTDLDYLTNPELLLSTKLNSERITNYEFDETYIKTIKSEEKHEMYITAKEEVGNIITTNQELEFVKSETVSILKGTNFDEVYDDLSKMYGQFTEESLVTEKEIIKSTTNKDLVAAVNSKRESLKGSLLGTLGSVENFIQLVGIARNSNKETIAKVLASKKNQPILHQLYDILGYVQTTDSHEAAMKKLHFDDQKQEDLSERYLWALSVWSQPNADILIDLLNKYKKLQNIPEKVKETLILSIGSMAYKLAKLPEQNARRKAIKEVEDTILNYLDASKGDERFQFLRALRNLKSTSSIPTLLKIATKGSQKEGVLAWKALKAMEPNKWNANVLTSARKTFYEIDKKHDSSSRTLALDILLESQPDDEFLKGILHYLVGSDKAFEVKQYTLQRLRMMADISVMFRKRLQKLIQDESKVNNYAGLSQRGLSVALNRPFLESDSSNGSLLSIQEMYGGIVKRGIVNVMMDKDGVSQEIFSLGVFSGGLGGFLSSSDSEGEVDDTPATAGMELSVLGTQIRPFTFFTGQGELMGHVWSGTASERTVAFQALTMLHDHSEYIRLGNGFLAELDVKGATSFDLSGRVEFSLWNRNAESLVEKSAGIMVAGLAKVETAFVRSQIDFKIYIEPKLSLQTDIDFSTGVNLCMRLTQPQSIFKHHILKTEAIPGSQYRLRKTKITKNVIPGKTYALNKKNSDMCNLIFR